MAKGIVRYVDGHAVSAFLIRPRRIIAVGPRSFNPMDACEVHSESFEPVWKALVDEQPVICGVTGTEHPAVGKPSMVMLDVREE
jgi:hypothetical protein